MRKAFKIPYLILNWRALAGAVKHQFAGEGTIGEDRMHIEAGITWLMRAQEKGGGGFSRRYCFYGGWDKPYIETTGYIIPTMLAAGEYLKDSRAGNEAKRAAYWLLEMQKKNGAFGDTDTGVEQVFDTGQVLAGLIVAYRAWRDQKLLDACARAGAWLAEVQEKDGSWERFAYNGIKHTYYVKVAASLLDLSVETGVNEFRESAMRNIQWALSHQKQDGYFAHMEFAEGEAPFLHTIMYVLEGLLDSYELTDDKQILGAAMKTVSALKEINRDRDMLLASQYGEDWLPVNRERCITGLAQWACIALRVHGLSEDNILFEQAVRTIYYLKSKQYLGPRQDLYGGLPGSVPLWGKYLGFCYPNWGTKYYIDSLLSYEKYRVPAWHEQQTWVSEAFRFSESVVSDELNAHDNMYLKLMEKGLDTNRGLTMLDVGCGRGKFIDYFRQKFPHWRVAGVDPFFYNGKDILEGSVYSLPVPDDFADVVLLIEVMQHVDHMERAMAELSRVLKKDGILVIGDRDGASIIGVLKPFMELAGLWMYPWDSPFREKWRSIKEWKRVLGVSWLVSGESFDNPENRIPGSNRFYLLMAQKKGR